MVWMNTRALINITASISCMFPVNQWGFQAESKKVRAIYGGTSVFLKLNIHLSALSNTLNHSWIC